MHSIDFRRTRIKVVYACRWRPLTASLSGSVVVRISLSVWSISLASCGVQGLLYRRIMASKCTVSPSLTLRIDTWTAPVFSLGHTAFVVSKHSNMSLLALIDNLRRWVWLIGPQQQAYTCLLFIYMSVFFVIYTLTIVRVVKSRRMRWVGYVARMGEGRGVHRVLVGKPEGKRPLRDADVDGRIILRWIFRKWEGIVGTGWSWLRIGRVGGHLWVR